MKLNSELIGRMCRSQSVQDVFMRIRLGDYFECLGEIIGKKEAEHLYNDVLPCTRLDTKDYLYDFLGIESGELPTQPDITIGEMLFAAVKMFGHEALGDYDWYDIDDETCLLMDSTARKIVYQIMIAPFIIYKHKKKAENSAETKNNDQRRFSNENKYY